MLRLSLLAVWVIAVTAAATYGSVWYQQQPHDETSSDAEDRGVEELKTEMTSVPMVRGGEIIGYVIIQLSFQADRKLLSGLRTEPLPYLIDAAFRVIFASGDIDFQRLRGSDLDRLTAEIGKEANSRIGAELVRTVLIQQLNYVRKEDIRTNWIKNGSNAESREE